MDFLCIVQQPGDSSTPSKSWRFQFLQLQKPEACNEEPKVNLYKSLITESTFEKVRNHLFLFEASSSTWRNNFMTWSGFHEIALKCFYDYLLPQRKRELVPQNKQIRCRHFVNIVHWQQQRKRNKKIMCPHWGCFYFTRQRVSQFKWSENSSLGSSVTGLM